jgi:glycosyltransferase involved in cell wall biosynthesis
MKVVLLVRGQSGVPGGQVGMIQIARTLARLGVEVELFAGGPRMRYLDGIDDVTTKYFNWPIWLDRLIKAGPARVQALGTSLRRRRWLHAVSSLPGLGDTDVIHVQGLKDAEALLTVISGPLVVTHWGRVKRWLPSESSPDENEGLQRRIRLLRDNVSLVAIGEAQGAALTSAGLPPAEIIEPGIDLQRFSPGDRAEARRRVNLPVDAPIVLYVGRLAPDKNVETLLKAFARLLPRSPRPRLLIIGEPPWDSQRLQFLRGWSHENRIEILTGVSRTGRPNGV